jgi:hypothetical protein
MQLAEMPIAVIMRRREVDHPWVDYISEVVAVLPYQRGPRAVQPLEENASQCTYLVSGLTLTLHRDENDGYFENWVAPEPKVFVMWQLEEKIAMPVIASVSYGEGTRMLDSGESADGVVMAHEIHGWLGAYLQAHYDPKPRRGRQHG